MITEDYVSFETAKLLKEKGFEPPHDYRKCLPIMYTDKDEIKWGVWSDDWYSRITLQMAMKWLREVYNIAVSVYVFNRDLPIKENGIRYTCDIATTKMSSKEGHLRLTGTYEEACETAIRYCLENLI